MFSSRRLVVAVLLWTATSGVAFAVDPLFQQSVIFSSGDGYPVYRVPGIVTSNYGTLLAFAEGRPSTSDVGANDIVLKRSLDNGLTWQAMEVPLSHSSAANLGFNSPTPVVDQATGDIYLFAASPVPTGSPGYADIYVTKSSDDGVTWSAPTDISAAVRPNDDKYITVGPGHGVQLDNGRLVVPIYTRALNDSSQSATPRIIYSDDDGVTWHTGNAVPKPTYSGQSLPVSLVEPSIVNTDHGLYMNMRTRAYAPSSNRSYTFSTDGGNTWSTSQIDPTLVDSNTEGALARWTTLADDGMNRILLSNTYSATARENLTVQTSYDEALTWTNGRTINFGMSGYSDMAAGANGLMNLLYENGRATDPRYSTLGVYQQITLAQFNTAWLETPTNYGIQYNFAEQASGIAPTTDAYIRDSGGWQLDMTVTTTGSAVYVQGNPHLDGRAIHLSGDGAGFLISDADSRQFFNFGATDGFTFEAVLRTTSLGDGMILGRGTNHADASPGFFPHLYFEISGGHLRLHLRDDLGNIADLSSSILINDGLWHSVAAIRDVSADILALVVDGQQVGLMIDPTTSFSSLLSPSSAWIGFNNDHSAYFYGDLDMVGLTRGTLSTSQLVAIPEPGTIVLTLTAVGGLLGRRYRSRRTQPSTSAPDVAS